MINSTVIITVFIYHFDVSALCKAVGLDKTLVDRNNFSLLHIALVVLHIAYEIAAVVTHLSVVIAVAAIHLASIIAVVVTHLAACASRKVDGLD